MKLFILIINKKLRFKMVPNFRVTSTLILNSKRGDRSNMGEVLPEHFKIFRVIITLCRFTKKTCFEGFSTVCLYGRSLQITYRPLTTRFSSFFL